MVSDRTARGIYLDAHANLTAVCQNLVLVLIHKVGINEL